MVGYYYFLSIIIIIIIKNFIINFKEIIIKIIIKLAIITFNDSKTNSNPSTIPTFIKGYPLYYVS